MTHGIRFGEYQGKTKLYVGLDYAEDPMYVDEDGTDYDHRGDVTDLRKAIVIDPGVEGIQHEVAVATDGGYVVKTKFGPDASRETYVHEQTFRQYAPLMLAILDHLQNQAVAPLEDQLRELLEHADFATVEFQASRDRLLAALREDRVKFW